MRYRIADRDIGPGHPAYVIAELSANHHQQLDRAKRLVRAAAEAGADAVKLQTYTAETITLKCDKEPFRINSGSLWDGTTLHELYEQAHTPWAWHGELAALAADLGLHCFSSPFDETAVAFLEQHDVPAYKVASFELVDLPLLRCIAGTGKPIIMSTGMATLAEIEEAVACVTASGGGPLALLRTNSGYPAAPEEMDLATIRDLQARFDVVVGVSDHTLGLAVPVAAVALGASIIEKHLTLSRAEPGPDSAFSLEPDELRATVDAVRTAERALGSVRYGPTERELTSLPFRRSLFVTADVVAGAAFTPENVRSIRPAAGLHTRHLAEVLGRRATRAIERGTPLTWELVE